MSSLESGQGRERKPRRRIAYRVMIKPGQASGHVRQRRAVQHSRSGGIYDDCLA